jgi:hypothetical protein
MVLFSLGDAPKQAGARLNKCNSAQGINLTPFIFEKYQVLRTQTSQNTVPEPLMRIGC